MSIHSTPAPSPIVQGACLCGAVTFEIAPPYPWFAHCHCSLCRKHHGTLFGTGLGVAIRRLRWLAGAQEIVHFRATGAFERPFCGHCGSKVPGRSHNPDFWHVPVGLLAGDVGARPRTHIFVASKSSLHTIGDALPQHDTYPKGVALDPVDAPARSAAGAAVSGSCLCGAVGFELGAAPRRLVHCHCSLCRRSRGTGFSSTLLAVTATFRWRDGADRIERYALSAPRSYRSDFCSACGSPVPSVIEGSPQVLVPAGSLDTELGPLPAAHLYVGSKAPWDDIADSWPQFAELPPRERFTEILG
jgi:hypothetical protein